MIRVETKEHNYYKQEGTYRVCGKAFKYRKSQRLNAEYCSKECCDKGKIKVRKPQVCQNCNNTFVTKSPCIVRKFCSLACAGQFRKGKAGPKFTGEVHGNTGKIAHNKQPIVSKVCLVCDKEFSARVRENGTTYPEKYCSNNCQTKVGVNPRHYRRGEYYIARLNKTVWYRSSYELEAYKLIEADLNVVDVQDEPFRLHYRDEAGRKHSYTVDILVTYKDSLQKLIEVKPEIFINSIVNQLKFKAMKQYSEDNKIPFEIWTEKDLFSSNGLTTTFSEVIQKATANTP